MSLVEEQAKEFGVDAARAAKDGGQERDTVIVSVGMRKLRAEPTFPMVPPIDAFKKQVGIVT
jgi:hypothetical protein